MTERIRVLVVDDSALMRKLIPAILARDSSIEVKTLAADLSNIESLEALVETLLSLDHEYTVLVNNAGFAVKGEFAITNLEDELRLLNVQLVAMVKLTKAVLPQMIERSYGRILNVASVYSFTPVPLQAVYGACKAFMMSFSNSLLNELKGSGVTVTTIYPGITRTAFRYRAGIADSNTSGMTAESVARLAYRGAIHGKQTVIPGFINRAFVLLALYMPARVFATFVRFINKRRGVN